MVKMRLVRLGDKKSPVYRIVVVDARKAATGEYIEKVGYYGERLARKGRSAHRNGQKPFGAGRRDRKVCEAQRAQDQRQKEEEIIGFRSRGRSLGGIYARFN